MIRDSGQQNQLTPSICGFFHMHNVYVVQFVGDTKVNGEKLHGPSMFTVKAKIYGVL